MDKKDIIVCFVWILDNLTINQSQTGVVENLDFVF